MDKVARAYSGLSDSSDVPDNFCGLPEEYSSERGSLFRVIPVAYEASVSYGKGASAGPRAIISASQHMELYDPETGLSAFVEGIATLPQFTPLGPEDMLEGVEARAAIALGEAAVPVTLGGEHSVTLGAVRAASSTREIGILQFDAHSDLRDVFDGSPFSHACVMRRCIEIDRVRRLLQVGIRSVSYYEREIIDKGKVRTLPTRPAPSAFINALDELPDDIYVTFDVDALDPTVMPSTGTPEPGGLGWGDALEMLRLAFSMRRVIGFDVVELAPVTGLTHPDYTAALLTYKMMTYGLYYRRNRS